MRVAAISSPSVGSTPKLSAAMLTWLPRGMPCSSKNGSFSRHGQRGTGAERYGFSSAVLLHGAVADGSHAVHPGQHGGRGVQDAGHRAGPGAGEPKRVVGGKVGDAGRGTEQEGLALQHVGQAPQVAAVGSGGIGRGQACHAHAHLGPVVAKHLGLQAPLLHGGVRRAPEHLSGAARREVPGHGRPEQLFVGPLRHDARQAHLVRRVQRGRGLAAFQHVADQRAVAIDVGADLQERRLAVAAGERHHIRLGHDLGNDHRLPGQLFVAQDQPDLFRKRRRGVVMQDEVAHEESPGARPIS